MTRNFFKPASVCLMFQWINGVEHLDVLSQGQIRWFVSLWLEFELAEYIVQLRQVCCLTINSVKSYPYKQHHVVSFTYTTMPIANMISGKTDEITGEFIIPYSAP